jgi:photosystem II stability/assembly factor-like uncharacterized protein
MVLWLCVQITSYAQPSTPADIEKSYRDRREAASNSVLRQYPVRNIGPTGQGGRIVDIDVNLANTKEFYVGYASGGIFKTTNNGITFEPYFDHQDALGIGDFALCQQDTKIMYVGTGEKNSSRSSYAGSGVYKTADGGKTWSSLGLAGTQHISRVLIHPTNPDVVWVAALGPLYTNSSERGVYKTTDGGKTWTKTLFVNDSTGIIDLVINPQDPNQLLASSWEKSRKGWNFTGNGAGSSIYRSVDGGNTWAKSVSGFPQGKQVGRIGLDVCASQPNVVYAILDNQAEVTEEKKEKDDGSLKQQDFKNMTRESFLKLDDKKLEDFLRNNGFPRRYDAKRVKKEVTEGKYAPLALYDYLGGDANANLFNTKIVGAEMYRSDNGGATWKKMNSYDLDNVFYTYGYYFAEMRVSPDNADLIYFYGVPMLKSRDGGVTWSRVDTVGNVHVDHHVLWVNPKDSKHLLLGNDGGVYQSYDEGANWLHLNSMPVGQFYTINVDMETPYNVYGGLQDNAALTGSSVTDEPYTIQWETLIGGDGMYAVADPTNSRLAYAGFQFGNYFRIERDRQRRTRITPTANLGEPSLRWNWRTPFLISKHNPDIVYMAAQKVFRSLNKGDEWTTISDDLTKNKNTGNVPFSTISSLAESPLKFGLLYAGTDDGNVWVSRNGGGSWDAINTGLPAGKWVSSITPSSHDEATVLISLNGYRDDDFRTYVFMSADYGKTWKSVKGNLPDAVANVIIQDPVSADLLYCGLDNGTYVSLDRGTTWHFLNGMLNVSSYDMIVHPRDNELVVGTHGRSVFVADVKPLQALKDPRKGVQAFAPESIRFSERWGEKSAAWAEPFEPKVSVLYYVGKPATTLTVEIYDEKNALVRKLNAKGEAGFQTWNWDVKVQPPVDPKSKSKAADTTLRYAGKGKYKIRFVNGTETSEVTLEIK